MAYGFRVVRWTLIRRVRTLASKPKAAPTAVFVQSFPSYRAGGTMLVKRIDRSMRMSHGLIVCAPVYTRLILPRCLTKSISPTVVAFSLHTRPALWDLDV